VKAIILIIGILIGGILGYTTTKFLDKPTESESSTENLDANISKKWEWADNLDALIAAPDNHKVVYEDENVRILSVILDGKQSEPIHTHKWTSVMWISKPITPCQINSYKKNENGQLVVSDSLVIEQMPTNIGQLINPEGPTSITNLGNDSGIAYRVEFKREFVK